MKWLHTGWPCSLKTLLPPKTHWANKVKHRNGCEVFETLLIPLFSGFDFFIVLSEEVEFLPPLLEPLPMAVFSGAFSTTSCILHTLKAIGKLWKEWNRRQPKEGKMATGRPISFIVHNYFFHFCRLAFAWTLKKFELPAPN